MTTTEEALKALEQAGAAEPNPAELAATARARRQKAAALKVCAALASEVGTPHEAAAWLATRPVYKIMTAVGMVFGEPNAETSRLVRMANQAMDLALPLAGSSDGSRIQRLVAQLEATNEPAAIDTLATAVTQAAIDLRSSRSGSSAWRRAADDLNTQVGQAVADLQSWLAESSWKETRS